MELIIWILSVLLVLSLILHIVQYGQISKASDSLRRGKDTMERASEIIERQTKTIGELRGEIDLTLPSAKEVCDD